MSGNILIGAGTGGLGCRAGTIGKMAKAYDVASNTVDTARGGVDMAQNGVSFTNTAQVLGGIGGNVANLKSKCFTAGTQIVVGIEFSPSAAGAGVIVEYTTKNIEDIETGDLVYSYDTATGEYGYKEVTNTFELRADSINRLTIVDENGREQTIETTDGHPFWVVSDDPDLSRAAGSYVDENGVWLYHENIAPTEHGYWVEAKDLRVGDVFLGADGKLSTLVSRCRVEKPGGIAVFNFTVEGNHDYFVLAKDFEYGQTCVLVHNGVKCTVDNPGELHVGSGDLDFNVERIRPKLNAQVTTHPHTSTAPTIHLNKSPNGSLQILDGETRAVRAFKEGVTIDAEIISNVPFSPRLPKVKDVAGGI